VIAETGANGALGADKRLYGTGFRRIQRMRDGLSSRCRRCHAAAVQPWRDENPEKAASYNLARRVKHRPRPYAECGEPFVPGRLDTLGLLGSVPLVAVSPAAPGGGVTRPRCA
jgi:hypothetical protein